MSLKILPSFSTSTNCEIPHLNNEELSNELDCDSLIVSRPFQRRNEDESDDNYVGAENEFDGFEHDETLDDTDIIYTEITNLNLLEANSRRYFAGYVLHMKLKKIKCENCELLLLKSSEDLLSTESKTECLIKNKNFFLGDVIKLHAPSDIYFEIVSMQVKLFLKCYETFCHKSNLKERILEFCMRALQKEYPNYFNDEFICFDHMKTYLNYLILILIRKHAKLTLEKMLKAKKNRKRGISTMDTRWKKYN